MQTDRPDAGTLPAAKATQQLGFALAFLKKTLQSGDGALMREHLLPFLPPLLLLQVIPHSVGEAAFPAATHRPAPSTVCRYWGSLVFCKAGNGPEDSVQALS